MFELGKIIGLKIVAIKAIRHTPRTVRDNSAAYVLFDDGKTMLLLEEQDYFSFHDCSTCAREFRIREDEKAWQMVMNEYPDAKEDW